MAFGPTNATRHFMRLMNTVLKEFIGKVIIFYLENILISIQTKKIAPQTCELCSRKAVARNVVN